MLINRLYDTRNAELWNCDLTNGSHKSQICLAERGYLPKPICVTEPHCGQGTWSGEAALARSARDIA